MSVESRSGLTFEERGGFIYAALIENVVAFTEAEGAEVRPERVALLAEQVEEYGLPEDPSDPGKWQAEALASDQLAEIVRAAVVAHINEQTLGVSLAREKAERTALIKRSNG